MIIKPKPSRHSGHAKKKRGPAFLVAQIVIGGGVGVLIAVLFLQFGKKYLGFGGAAEGPVGIAESRDTQSRDAEVEEASKPSAESRPRESSPRVGNRPRINNGNKPGAEDLPVAETPPKAETTEPKNVLEPVKAARTPITKEALAESFSKAKIPAAARYWWCDEGAFELSERGEFRLVDKAGHASNYLAMAATSEFLELEAELHDRRIKLYLDHAESSSEPFTAYQPLYSAGRWIVAPDQTGVEWFPKAVLDLDATSRKARVTAKEYMRTLFSAAEKLNAAGRLKDVPFGFDLRLEQERFANTGLVPWTAPLLPLTAEYAQECRKMHRNEETMYSRVANRMTGQKEKAAKDFLAYHQWRNARAWPLAVVAWSDPDSGKETHYSLLSNGTVNDDASKNTWKLTDDILDVDIGDRRVRLKIGQTGKEFSLLGQEKPVTGKFVFDGVRVAY